MQIKEQIILQTERLILRPWKVEDLEPYAKMNADPKVREHFPSTLTKEESDREAQIFMDSFQVHGWGLWAVTIPDITDFIGFIGLRHVPFSAHFTPAVEIGWRLDYKYWNHGYATEGAEAAMKFGFENLSLNLIVSFTAVNNVRSRRVMEKIGMKWFPEENFEHPRLPQGHFLREQVLYKKNSNK